MKKNKCLFIISILFSTQVWGEILELTDSEKVNKEYARVKNNFEDFYIVNRDSIAILKEQGFFQGNDIKNRQTCNDALEKIRSNENSLIFKAYFKKGKRGLSSLRKDLESTEAYFSSDTDKESKTILSYARGIFLILKCF